jgi:hypothetical protein
MRRHTNALDAVAMADGSRAYGARMKHLTRIERIVPYLMDGLAALAGGVVATTVILGLAAAIGDLMPGAKTIAGLFCAASTAGAFLAVRIMRASIRNQVHMELAEGGK